jgi:hypothetical protein
LEQTAYFSIYDCNKRPEKIQDLAGKNLQKTFPFAPAKQRKGAALLKKPLLPYFVAQFPVASAFR